MWTLTYGEGFRAVSDFKVEEVYQQLLELERSSYTGGFSTTNIFNRIRLGIIRGDLDPRGIGFVYHGVRMSMDIYGDILNWVPGFLSDDAVRAREIVIGASAKRRDDRKKNGN